MSPVQFISHHLFVAAAGHGDQGPEKTSGGRSPAWDRKSQASLVALELLEAEDPSPARNARPINIAVVEGGR